MIGSISKVRPCGHSCHYKYAHCKTAADMQAASNRNYLKDKDAHGRFLFPLLQLKSATNLFNDSVAEYFDVDFPEATEASGVFSFRTNTKLKYFKGNFPKCTYAHAFAFRCNGSVPRRDIILNMPSATNITSAFSECVFGTGGLKIYAPKATDISGIDTWMSASNVNTLMENSDFYMPNVEKATDVFCTINYKEVYYWLNENGESVVGHGGTPTEKKYFVFPKLKSGYGLFFRSTITADYATAICQSLPDWSGDTSSHPISLGLHVDDKYNPDLQMELLKVGNNYTPTINVSGGPTTNKNWELTIKWNGTSDGDAYMPPYVPVIEFSSNDLPENYTRCNYLESNGNQYIKTDYIPTGTTGMYVDAYKTGGDMICGCTEYWYYWGGGNFILLGYNTYYGDVQYNGDTKGRMKVPYHYVGRLNYKNDRTMVVETDGVNRWIKENLPELNFTPTRDIYFFRHNRASGNPISSFQGKVYRAQITEGEELIRDFVPCLDAEGVPCMRDLVNGVDYYNAGSGQFTYELA